MAQKGAQSFLRNHGGFGVASRAFEPVMSLDNRGAS